LLCARTPLLLQEKVISDVLLVDQPIKRFVKSEEVRACCYVGCAAGGAAGLWPCCCAASGCGCTTAGVGCFAAALHLRYGWAADVATLLACGWL
jgi:hypothetical protein